MANTITNFPNSFVQFTTVSDANCYDQYKVNLPIKYRDDFRMQFLLTDPDPPDPDTANFIFIWCKQPVTIGADATSLAIASCDPDLSILDDGSIVHMVNWTGDCNNNLMTAIDGVAIGSCIYPAIKDKALNTIYAISTQVFTVIGSRCFTNLIRYRCDENSFGFIYEGADLLNFYNSARLNITLHSPINPVRKGTFRLSDGSYKKLFVVVEEEVQADVDYLNAPQHKKLVIALEHDQIYMAENPNNDCSMQKYMSDEGADYDVDWKETPGKYTGRAKAKFKIKKNPFLNQNCNC